MAAVLAACTGGLQMMKFTQLACVACVAATLGLGCAEKADVSPGNTSSLGGSRTVTGVLSLAGRKATHVVAIPKTTGEVAGKATVQPNGAFSLPLARGATYQLATAAGGRILTVLTFEDGHGGRTNLLRLAATRGPAQALEEDLDTGTWEETSDTQSGSTANPLAQEDGDHDGTDDLADADDDNDGTPDATDADADNDGVVDSEQEGDSDNDGDPDCVDADDDNDGVVDVADSDDDGDGAEDAEDDDRDHDGRTNNEDDDDDGDGLADTDDADDEGDGVSDTVGDDDDDGIANTEDGDDDGDGVEDAEDSDDDNDGVSDEDESTDGDEDDDGTPDDEDDDHDGEDQPDGGSDDRG